MTPAVEQVAQALIALRDAQYHIRKASKLLFPAECLDLIIFDIENMATELVFVAKSVQSVSQRQ
jgi:hypothetical protein